MKKIAIIALMASVLFAACGENTRIDIKYDHPERYSVGDATLTQPISGISVDWLFGDVDIRYTDNPAVRIYEEAQGLTDSLRMRYYVDEEGELEIQYCGNGKYRYGDLKNMRKHLYIEVPHGMELKDIDIDGVEVRVIIKNVVSRELTVDGVKINVNAYYPDAMPGDIDVDGVNNLLALWVKPTVGMTIDMAGVAHWLDCNLPSRKEGENTTVVGDGQCKVDVDGVNAKLSVDELNF